jgi:predicted ATPase
MGTVYEAIDRERDTAVALKTINAESAAAGVGLKREFRLVADLVHPNLATVFELGSDQGLWFFTMERIEGVSLTKWARGGEHADSTPQLPLSRQLSAMRAPTVPQGGEVTSTDADSEYGKPAAQIGDPGEASAPTRDMMDIRRAFAELASAIGALHDAGLRHGDVKPANVLVRYDGRVVLVDFGLARDLHERGGQDSSGGTPAYMPPEQIVGGPIGPNADWYALGATLYHVLTGWTPFLADSRLNLYLKKQHQPPIAPAALDAAIPVDLSQLCLQLLSAEPERRPSRDHILEVLAAEQATAAEPRQRIVRAARTFVGRESELSRLEQAYGTARGGQLTLVHLHGPSGIGKSALLANFLDAVQDVDSAIVLRGRCYERENVPYKGFDRIVDELAGRLSEMSRTESEALLPEWTPELAAVFPALAAVPAIAAHCEADSLGAQSARSLDAMELRRRAWVAMSRLLLALRKRYPIVLVIDDLQWADTETAQLLAELLEESERAALMVVASYRSMEAANNPALTEYLGQCEALEASGWFVDLPVEALPPAESERLARAALVAAGVDATSDLVSLLAREAAGVPFLIEELAHFVAYRGGSELGRGISLDEAISARISLLPRPQRAVVEVVSVASSPLPQSIVFEVVGLDAGALGSLLDLRSASLVSWLGAGADDTVTVYHDRIRECVESSLSSEATRSLHLALGRALSKRVEADESLLFDAVRHLGIARAALTDPDERRTAAELHLKAGHKAHSAAAFPLALDCFEGGIELLNAQAWQSDYDLSLALHTGAVETAYLCANWDTHEKLVLEVKQKARTALDQSAAWESEVDALAGRHEFAPAIECAVEALSRLGVDLPSDPDEATVGAAVESTLARLTELGPEAVGRLADLDDPVAAAATRIQVRLSPVAYFVRPMLLPIIACNLVATSIDRGVSTATPYALSLFGIVLNSLRLFPVSHTWGQLALEMLERFPDRRLEAATRHILHNLVCNWMVPLESTLNDLRAVFDLGLRTGDYEYASYAAHGYVHNSIYAGRPLEPLLAEALELGERMRSLGQVNAVHVHAPFEQLLKSLVGATDDPSNLDDDGFSERQSLEAAEAVGSRSGIFVMKYLPGLVRFYFGREAEAHDYFEEARQYVDGVPSIWHLPMLDQFGALAACNVLFTTDDEGRREALRGRIDERLASLREMAHVMPENFAHRATIVEAELLRVDGALEAAARKFDQAIAEAQRGSWVSDIALANELASRCHVDPEFAMKRTRAARMAYSAWGAKRKAESLSLRLEQLSGA